MPKRKNAGSGKYPEAKKRVVKPYTRWRHKGPPITEYKNVPKGWPADDRDIHEDDVLANIERCKQRIEDGIMPQWWERRLKKYEACKAEYDKEVKSAVPGLDHNVILRLRDLRTLKSDLEKAGDKRKLVPNIDAIIEAYNSKKLIWNDGLVTYWSKGKKICDGPKEFKWEDFDSYSDKHQGHESFWVEGLHGPGPLPAFLNYAPNKKAFTIAPRDAQFLHEIYFALRVPSIPTQNSASDDNISDFENFSEERYTLEDYTVNKGANERDGEGEDKEQEADKKHSKSRDDEEEGRGENDKEEEKKVDEGEEKEVSEGQGKEEEAEAKDGETKDNGKDERQNSKGQGKGKEKEKASGERDQEEENKEEMGERDIKKEDEIKREKDNDEDDTDPQDGSLEFSFIDDTGSAVMVLYEDDLERLEEKNSSVAKIVGAARLNGAFGGWYVIVYRIEVNLRDHEGNYMLDWTPVQVAVINGDRPLGHMRLSGPWMRHRFFVGTSPNRKGILCVARNKSLFVQQIEPVAKEDIAGVPADLRLPPNPPGALYAQHRGDAYPGEAEPGRWYDGDSDNNVAVRYHTAKEDRPGGLVSRSESGTPLPVDTIEV